jgi:RNA polymerase sigma factor (TIGR02999 family)
LQPTALVHEAYLRLVDQAKQPDWQSRSHFYGVAARLMRQILVDHARRKQAGKRAGLNVPLEQAVSFEQNRSPDLIALDAGLKDLERIDPRKFKAVELRYFGGLSMEEIAQSLKISEVTVRRDLRMAEAWLYRDMQRVSATSLPNSARKSRTYSIVGWSVARNNVLPYWRNSAKEILSCDEN